MSLATEATYRAAVLLAEGVRQQSKAAARVTYAFNPSNYAAYVVALNDADAAYLTSVNTALNTLDVPTTRGVLHPIDGGAWTPLTGMA